jgi:hypothetical protein
MTLKSISLLFLACWLGAAVFFSGVVAPAAFSVLRAYQIPNTNEIAGAIVNRSLSVINVSGFVIGLLCIVFTLLGRLRYERWAFLVQTGALLIVTALCAVGHWIIAARMRAIRAALSLPIDQIAFDDPSRIAFAALHRYSVLALAIAMIAAMVASLLLARTGTTNQL